MSPSEAQKLLEVAKAWETAAESHKKEMWRNRSFAQPGRENYEFYLAESAREEIKAQLCESHAKRLKILVNELIAENKPVVAETGA